jgi:hypothetical protein
MNTKKTSFALAEGEQFLVGVQLIARKGVENLA